MTLRDACEKLLTYRKQAGPLGYQLEKADDYHRMIRAALDAPDITDDLAAALRSVVHECDAVFVDVSEMSPEWRAIEANARELLARYDAQKPDSPRP